MVLSVIIAHPIDDSSLRRSNDWKKFCVRAGARTGQRTGRCHFLIFGRRISTISRPILHIFSAGRETVGVKKRWTTSYKIVSTEGKKRSVDGGTMWAMVLFFKGVVGLQTHVPRLCKTRSLIAIYEAGMLRRRGFVHTLSRREGVRATAGFARLRGSPLRLYV